MQPQTLKQQPKPKTFLTNTLKVTLPRIFGRHRAASTFTENKDKIYWCYCISLHMVSKHFTQHYIQKLCLNLTIGNETVLPKNPQNGCSKAGARGAQISYLHSIMLSIPLSLPFTLSNFTHKWQKVISSSVFIDMVICDTCIFSGCIYHCCCRVFNASLKLSYW